MTSHLKKPVFANFVCMNSESVRRNPRTCRATDAEIEETMKCWLKPAADREGGRDRRIQTMPASSR